MAWRSVDFPWYPPPQIRVTPPGTNRPDKTTVLVSRSMPAMPPWLWLLSSLLFPRTCPIQTGPTQTRSVATVMPLPAGARNGTAGGLAIGAALAPLLRGSTDPSATKAMAPPPLPVSPPSVPCLPGAAEREESLDRSFCCRTTHATCPRRLFEKTGSSVGKTDRRIFEQEDSRRESPGSIALASGALSLSFVSLSLSLVVSSRLLLGVEVAVVVIASTRTRTVTYSL
mmetsp:Transcript_2250/g.4680  ORF Transcript_2250/g.4680 Transcript_2250/m.4680 type:complete len:227 (-) Transcript_2250:127-807(-)